MTRSASSSERIGAREVVGGLGGRHAGSGVQRRGVRGDPVRDVGRGARRPRGGSGVVRGARRTRRSACRSRTRRPPGPARARARPGRLLVEQLDEHRPRIRLRHPPVYSPWSGSVGASRDPSHRTPRPIAVRAVAVSPAGVILNGMPRKTQLDQKARTLAAFMAEHGLVAPHDRLARAPARAPRLRRRARRHPARVRNEVPHRQRASPDRRGRRQTAGRRDAGQRHGRPVAWR